MEVLPRKSYRDIDTPDCLLGFYDTIFVYDHWGKQGYIVSTGLPERDTRKKEIRARERVKKFKIQPLIESIRGRVIKTRPIKGTRPRGANPQEDESLIRGLRESPKERAEHIMIVDLERNDLGRVCE
ncbi:MAG: chorismate-binding protein [Deltaproteobacteria bacterium]|nr:chorismate-binding protein [Deltaproteobacteria bacterium]